MTMSAHASRLVFCLMVVLVGSRSVAAEKPAVEARAAFARLKTLAGDWKVSATFTGDARCDVTPGKIAYKVISNGSTLMETYFPGTDHEMVTMYHVDGDELRLTHYCSAGNQPRLKLDRAASTPDNLVFAFDGGSNLDPAKDMHMHSGRIQFLEGGRVDAEWEGYNAGKKMMATKFALARP